MQRVARRELSAEVQMVLAPGTAASTRAPQGPRGEGLSHGWDETGGGQEPGVSQLSPGYHTLTLDFRTLNLNLYFQIVSSIRIEDM